MDFISNSSTFLSLSSQMGFTADIWINVYQETKMLDRTNYKLQCVPCVGMVTVLTSGVFMIAAFYLEEILLPCS